MAKKATPPAIVMTDGKKEIIRQLLSEYEIKTAEDIQDALKNSPVPIQTTPVTSIMPKTSVRATAILSWR